MQGSERKALGEIQPSCRFLLGGRLAAVHFSPGHVSGDRFHPSRRQRVASSEVR